jgi:hypothetical protein
MKRLKGRQSCRQRGRRYLSSLEDVAGGVALRSSVQVLLAVGVVVGSGTALCVLVGAEDGPGERVGGITLSVDGPATAVGAGKSSTSEQATMMSRRMTMMCAKQNSGSKKKKLPTEARALEPAINRERERWALDARRVQLCDGLPSVSWTLR